MSLGGRFTAQAIGRGPEATEVARVNVSPFVYLFHGRTTSRDLQRAHLSLIASWELANRQCSSSMTIVTAPVSRVSSAYPSRW